MNKSRASIASNGVNDGVTSIGGFMRIVQWTTAGGALFQPFVNSRQFRHYGDAAVGLPLAYDALLQQMHLD